MHILTLSVTAVGVSLPIDFGLNTLRGKGVSSGRTFCLTMRRSRPLYSVDGSSPHLRPLRGGGA